jgi:hypothetical protein
MVINMKKPFSFQKLELPFKAVLIRCLDENQKFVDRATATGFIRRENGSFFLYTCWHVVTGYDRNNLKVKYPPNRVFLQVELQDAQERQSGVTAIGGLQSFVIPLYDVSVMPKHPLWEQDDTHIPHSDLNAINIFVPYWFDAVKLKLPSSVHLSALQIIEENNFITETDEGLRVGDKLYIVGYPYGFSAAGTNKPLPVVLTRFVASTDMGHDRRCDILLESAGAPSMSGAPVFLERNFDVVLVGLYTGLIYPDHVIQQNEKSTALGVCSDMRLYWLGAISFACPPLREHLIENNS